MTFRFVTDENVQEGGVVKEKDRTQHNKEKDVMESVYAIYQVVELKEKRKARGDWNNWPSHPTYYNTTGNFKGFQFESNLGTEIFIK